MATQLTRNEDVSALETMGFSVGDMIYRTKLRDLVVEKVDDPKHIFDERLLAMCDGAFGLIEPWKGN